jgi:hypothetical protein
MVTACKACKTAAMSSSVALFAPGDGLELLRRQKSLKTEFSDLFDAWPDLLAY